MSFTPRTDWKNKAVGAPVTAEDTPILAQDLTRWEQGIAGADSAATAAQTAAAGAAAAAASAQTAAAGAAAVAATAQTTATAAGKDSAGRILASFPAVSKTEVATARRLAIANNCFATGAQLPAAQTVAGTSRVPHLVGATATDLQVIIGNHYTDPGSNFGDVAASSSIAVRAALEIGGVVYPLNFGGKRDVTIDGGGFATSDRLPVTVNKGDVIYSRIYTSSTSWWANKHSVLNNGASGGWTATTDLTGSGAAAVANVGAWQLAPMAIVGTCNADGSAVVVFGDSVAHGYADGSDTQGFVGQYMDDMARAGGGYLVRGLSGKAGIINAAVSSDSVRFFVVPAGHWKRMHFAQHATTAVIAYGRNDISSLNDHLVVAGNNVAIAQRAKQRGMITIVTTVTPRTTSTDNFFTSGNQALATAPMEVIRVAYNSWLRAGAPLNPTTLAPVAVGTAGALVIGQPKHPIDKVWDATSFAESALNSGVWKGAERVVADAAMNSGSSSLSSASAAFTTADVGKAVTVVGAGAAGAALSSVIRGVAGGVATLNNAASTTVSAASCGIGIFTFDGTHPNQYGAAVMSAVVNSVDLLPA